MIMITKPQKMATNVRVTDVILIMYPIRVKKSANSVTNQH